MALLSRNQERFLSMTLSDKLTNGDENKKK